MPYSTTVTGLDLSDGIANVRVMAGYAYSQVGPAAEIRQDSVTLDIDADTFKSTNPIPFSYAGSLAPPPAPQWDIALWVQEIPRIASDSGWLFRSGAFQTEPSAEVVDIIVAPMTAIGAAELNTAIGTLPIISGSTTINAASTTVDGTDLLLSAAGTDTNLPAGISFTFDATLVLTPNPSVRETESPFALRLDNPILSFVAGPGTGFGTALLNAIRGPIFEDWVKPRILATLTGRVNSGVLSTVATRLNRGVPASMPPGVVLSVRNLRAGTRPLGAGTEPVIEVRAALGAFGGVANKFPAGTFGGSCFIATAATAPDSPEVGILRRLRDERLAVSVLGREFIRWYARISPRIADTIRRSAMLRGVVRAYLVRPAARIAAWILARDREH
jgi:hypothetical protein